MIPSDGILSFAVLFWRILIVYYVSAESTGPKFASPISSLTVAVGRDAVLKCVVDDLGDYRVAWIHVDKQVLLTIHTHVITRSKRVAVTHHNFRTWFLHLKNVQPEDSGYYMCQINTQPMISQVGYLDIVVPPEFVNDQPGRNVSVMENGNVTLSCRASGNPTPKIKWRREDDQIIPLGKQQVRIFNGEELTLNKVSRQSMGAYLCIASNGVPPAISRRINLEVAFPPMIWIPNQLVGAPLSTTTSLECHTEAHPPANNLWTRDGYVIGISEGKFETFLVSLGYKVHMKLIIKDIGEDDYGVYRCVSKNALGETEGSVNLYRIKATYTSDQSMELTEPPVYLVETKVSVAPIVEEDPEEEEDGMKDPDLTLQQETEVIFEESQDSSAAVYRPKLQITLLFYALCNYNYMLQN